MDRDRRVSSVGKGCQISPNGADNCFNDKKLRCKAKSSNQLSLGQGTKRSSFAHDSDVVFGGIREG